VREQRERGRKAQYARGVDCPRTSVPTELGARGHGGAGGVWLCAAHESRRAAQTSIRRWRRCCLYRYGSIDYGARVCTVTEPRAIAGSQPRGAAVRRIGRKKDMIRTSSLQCYPSFLSTVGSMSAVLLMIGVDLAMCYRAAHEICSRVGCDRERARGTVGVLQREKSLEIQL
jgi:hypothetical protein